MPGLLRNLGIWFLIVFSKKLSPPGRGEDKIAWSPSKDGCFSNNSAYLSLLDQNLASNCKIYRMIWSWNGPERYRFHLWKIVQSALVTNVFRFRRGLSASVVCPLCDRDVESEMHLLRDCWLASQVWSFLINNSLPHNFLLQDLYTWIESNLRDSFLVKGFKWCLVFNVTVLLIWHARNDFVFNGKRPSGVGVGKKILCRVAAINDCYNETKLASLPICSNSIRSCICGVSPVNEFVKLNVDGAVTGLYSYSFRVCILINQQLTKILLGRYQILYCPKISDILVK